VCTVLGLSEAITQEAPPAISEAEQALAVSHHPQESPGSVTCLHSVPSQPPPFAASNGSQEWVLPSLTPSRSLRWSQGRAGPLQRHIIRARARAATDASTGPPQDPLLLHIVPRNEPVSPKPLKMPQMVPRKSRAAKTQKRTQRAMSPADEAHASPRGPPSSPPGRTAGPGGWRPRLRWWQSRRQVAR